MALRAKFSETGRKIKYTLGQSIHNSHTPQDSKFEVSFNDDGVFHNGYDHLKYEQNNHQTFLQSNSQHQQPSNQLRFGKFWQMDAKKEERYPRNMVLAEINNTYQANQAKTNYEKIHLVGSIKRNKKQSRVIQNNILQDQFFEDGVNLEEIQQLSVSKLDQMNARLNKAINKENCFERQPDSNRQKYSSKSPFFSNPDRKIIKQHQKPQLASQKKQERKQIPVDYQSSKVQNNKTFTRQKEQEERMKAKQSNKQTFYIQFIFCILDSKKIGMLSKQNCNIQAIPQEFKFIFGGIFTRIFLKKLTCNKRQFVKLCTNSLKQLNSQQVFDLLKLFIERYQEREQIFADQSAFLQQQNLQRYGYKSDCEPSIKAGAKAKQINSQYHIYQHQEGLSINNYSELKMSTLKKYNNRAVLPSNQKDKQSTLKSQSYVESYSQNSNFKEENINYRPVSKKRASVSEQTLQQHKRGLLDLAELEKKMENALKQSLNAEKSLPSGTECLKFCQLVKHI